MMMWFVILIGYVLLLPFITGMAISFAFHKFSRGSGVRASLLSWIAVLALVVGVEAATTGVLRHPEGYIVVVVLSLVSIPLGKRLAERSPARQP